MAKLLGYDPLTGVRTNFHWNESDESFVIEETQDATEIAEKTKAKAKLFDERTPWKGNHHHVASIPVVVYEDLWRRGIAQNERRFKRWLNDRDNNIFRTRPGKV